MGGFGNAQQGVESQSLCTTAQSYLGLGFSVIPVQTDPGRAKVAAVGWKPYQQRHATEAELRGWFLGQEYSGIAIVTGAVSGLIVLDFDDRHLYERFCHAYPDLRQTYTVRTRRGHHLYYRIPENYRLCSRKGQGIDLQAEGSYVVAPPTTIDEYSYHICLAVPPRTLTPNEIVSFEAFLTRVNPNAPDISEKREFGAFSCEIEGMGKDYPQPQRQLLTSSDLQYLYAHLAQKGSRNEALFRVSLKARDEGWHREQVAAALVDVHVQQPTASDHRQESPKQRHSEAVKTIDSAFSRPRRMFTGAKTHSPQIPNSVREKLFQLHQTYTVRVLDGLRLAGLQPGQTFTTQQALELLKGRVGRDSVYHALNATTDGDDPIFAQVNPPLDTPKSRSYADEDMSTGQPKNAFLVESKNQEKPQGGRPERLFVMPTNLELCRKLKVKLTWSDPLTEDDLASAKQTRMAVHREFIRRRPGIYPRKWLARRLGICTVTLDTYNREIPVNVRHCYHEKPITWHNLHELPLSLDIAGAFLEDEQGKRYPAKREIAQKLLAKKHTVTYKHQDANFYWLGDLPPSALIPNKLFVQPKASALMFPPFQRPMEPYRPPASTQVSQTNIYPHTGSVSWKPQPSTTQIEALAERVYRQVNRRAEPAQRISQANAKRLVETYGIVAVEQGLKRLEWYAKKGRVERPVGFLMTVSRVAWRSQKWPQ